MKGYSTNNVAELLGINSETIREIARSGVLDPERTGGNHYRFSFQDIVILRTAKELLDAGVRKARLNKSLLELKQRLPAERSLSSMRIAGDGGAVVICQDEQMYNAESGQIHFN
ncbi:MAG: MerR family transcriptional regulator, partial [OM182 bacterium]